MTVNGAFVWNTLVTNDIDASIGFYTKLVGWDIREVGSEAAPYHIITKDQHQIGGMVSLGSADSSVPPHWMVFISTPAIDDTIEKAEQLGGKVVIEPNYTRNFGTWAVLQDPQGSAFGVVQLSLTGFTLKEPSVDVGDWSWNELLTSDFVSAFGFYSSLFEWHREDISLASRNVASLDASDLSIPGDIYMKCDRASTSFGAIYNKPERVSRPFWLTYLHVDEIEEMVKTAKTLGAEVITEPHVVLDDHLVAHIRDPQRAVFALHSFAASA